VVECSSQVEVEVEAVILVPHSSTILLCLMPSTVYYIYGRSNRMLYFVFNLLWCYMARVGLLLTYILISLPTLSTLSVAVISKPNYEDKSCVKPSFIIYYFYMLQIQGVLGVDDNVPVKYSSEVLLYVDKYEIV